MIDDDRALVPRAPAPEQDRVLEGEVLDPGDTRAYGRQVTEEITLNWARRLEALADVLLTGQPRRTP